VSHVEVKQLEREGNSVGHRIFWEAKSDVEITSGQAQELQASHGYHPCGYGFGSFECKEVDGKYVATWTCSCSSD